MGLSRGLINSLLIVMGWLWFLIGLRLLGGRLRPEKLTPCCSLHLKSDLSALTGMLEWHPRMAQRCSQLARTGYRPSTTPEIMALVF